MHTQRRTVAGKDSLLAFLVLIAALLMAGAQTGAKASPVAQPEPVVEQAVLASAGSASDPVIIVPTFPIVAPEAATASTQVQPAPAGTSASAQPPSVAAGSIQAESGQGESPPSASAQAADPATGTVQDQGEIIVTGRPRSPTDPIEKVNVQSYKATQAVDSAVIAPVVTVYKEDVPRPIRRGLHNFLSNLLEPNVFVNYLLQLKPGKAAETFGRFAINTTIGGAGLFDIAKRKPFKLPRRPNGFANTLGYYGVKPGPYMYLPIVGPTTVRDFLAGRLDLILLPLAVGSPFNKPAFIIPTNILGSLDDRAQFDEKRKELRATDDPYRATREYYLKDRQAEIDALHSQRYRDAHPRS
jgi:phospholipid-binding lipoprotein MlaA